MSVLYKIKLLSIPENSTIFVVQLIPTNDSNLSPLRRNLRISPDRVAEIATLPSEAEQIAAYRKEVLRFDAGFQADWEGERVRKSVTLPTAISEGKGYEFPAVSEAEIAAANRPPEPDEVIL